MIKLPEFPTIEFPSIDFASIDFSKLPSFDFSKLDLDSLRNVQLPNLRDAAYITVGLGVVAVERAQARRQQLTAVISERVDQVRGLIRSAV